MNLAVSLDEVLARPDVWCADRLASAAVPTLPSGFAALDAELPGSGWPRGALTEILVDDTGVGECSLLLPALARMHEEGRWSLLVAPPYAVHGPAWAAAGADLTRLAVAAPAGSPGRQRDALWAAEHALASGAVGAVLCWAKQVDAAHIRRLQVAAAGSGTLAFLFRPLRARGESSAAALRLAVSAGAGGMLAVDLIKRRGTPCGRTLQLAVPRPLPWREEFKGHEIRDAHDVNNANTNAKANSTLARAASAVPAARSLRPVVLT
jgi:cell division inhibitor SulA